MIVRALPIAFLLLLSGAANAFQYLGSAYVGSTNNSFKIALYDETDPRDCPSAVPSTGLTITVAHDTGTQPFAVYTGGEIQTITDHTVWTTPAADSIRFEQGPTACMFDIQFRDEVFAVSGVRRLYVMVEDDLAQVIIATGMIDLNQISSAELIAALLETNCSSVSGSNKVGTQLCSVINNVATATASTIPTAVSNLQTDVDTLTTNVATVDTVIDRVEADTQDLQNRTPASLVAGRMDVSVGAMAANTMTAAAAAADLTTELQTGLATSSEITALDTVVDRVEADTIDIQDRLPAALNNGRIDANVGSIAGDETCFTGGKITGC